MKYIFFDIETSGLSGVDDEFILADFFYHDKNYEHIIAYDLKELIEVVNDLNDKFDQIVLIGKNIDNYRGGFDFPFLRTQFALNGLNEEWPFSGMTALDIEPILSTYLQTKMYEIKPPSYSSLNKDNLVEICDANDLEYTTKKETYNKLMDIFDNGESINWNGYSKVKCKDKNDLQSIYQVFFDPEIEEEYIDGAEVPQLYMLDNIDKIEYHCKEDCRRTKDVWALVHNMIPHYYVQRNQITL